ncbi:MAG: hypothetical protein P8K09_05815 [Hyphomicrobiales bacterium]|jgi:hypothetical protein|nr:hypothetical protein [Hyphomicrobiales bacterium]
MITSKKKNIISVTILVIALIFIFTSPTKKDFDKFVSDKVRNYTINIGENNQTANIVSGLTFYILQNNKQLIIRENYVLFSLYKIDASMFRSFGANIDDLVIVGVLGNFFVLKGID